MKLHLPKALLTAVLAACMVNTTAWGASTTTENSGWGKIYSNGNPANDSYAIGDATGITEISTADSTENNLFLRSNKGVGTATVGTLNVTGKKTLNVQGWWNDKGGTEHPQYLTLTIKAVNLLGGSTLNVAQGNSITTEYLQLHNSGAYTTETLNVTGSTVKVTGSDGENINDENKSSNTAVIIGHWHYGKGIVNVGSTTANSESLFEVSNGTLRMSWDSSSELNITQNGTVNVKGIQFANTNDDNATISLKGGRLNLGEDGIFSHANREVQSGYVRELNLQSGTLGALASSVNIGAGDVNLSGAVTIDTAILGSDGVATGGEATITFSQALNALKGASLTIQGGGTVSLSSINMSHTLNLSILNDTNLTIEAVVLNPNTMALTTKDGYYSMDGGTTQSKDANGFLYNPSGDYVLFDGYAWKGTQGDGYTVYTEGNSTYVHTAPTISTTYYLTTVKADIDASKIKAETYAVQGGTMNIVGTMNGSDIQYTSGSISLANKNSMLVLDSASNAASLLSLVTTKEGDAGKVKVAVNTTLTGANSIAGGNLIIAKDKTLQVGNGYNDKTNISSFSSVTLDGGTLFLKGYEQTVHGLTVDQDSTLKVSNYGNAIQTYTLDNLTTLNANLTITSESNEKGKVVINELTGSKDIYVSGGHNNNGPVGLTIKKITNYTGIINVDGGNRSANLNYVAFTADGDISLKGLNLTNKGQVDLSGVSGTKNLGTVVLDGSSSLQLSGAINMVASGAGALTLAAGTSTSGTVSIASDFSGRVETRGDSVLSNLTFKATGGTSSVMTLTGLKNTGNSDARNYIKIFYSDANTVKIERQRSDNNQGTQISKLDLTDGSTIIFYGTSNNIVTTIDELIVAGSATVKAEHHEGDVKITGLSGTGATLNLVTKTPTSRTSRFTLSDSDSHTHAFSGTINVYTTTDSGNRRTVFNLNSATAAQNAVVTLADCSSGADTVALAIGADKVTIAGLADGTGHTEDGKLMVVSGEQDIGEAAFKSDTNVRTLEINTAENTNWESSALIEENVNLVKSGEGSQTFNGSVASTSVSVLGGGLSLTGIDTLQLQDLVVKSGATLSVGSNDRGVVSFVNSTAATASTTSSTQGAKARLEGGAIINGSLDLSGATLELSGITAESDTAIIEGNLKLTTGTLTLSGDVLSALAEIKAGECLTIMTIGENLIVNGQVITESITADSVDYSFAEVFTNEGYDDFYLGFDYVPADEAGYSTVYIGMIVPEPTTATLSLLALAALAARRRRK